MSAMNTHAMDGAFCIRPQEAVERNDADFATGLRELVDATAACRRTAAQARKTLSGMEPEMRGLRLIAINGAL